MQLREGMAYATGLSICLALFAAAELSNQKGSHRSCQKLQHPLYYRKHRKQELHSNMSWSHHCNTHRSGIHEGARYKRAHSAGEEETDSVLTQTLQQRRLFLLCREQAELHLLGGHYRWRCSLPIKAHALQEHGHF